MSDQNERRVIDTLTESVYRCLCFAEGELPQFEKLKSHFREDARLMSRQNGRLEIRSLDTFMANLRAAIENGKLSASFEKETDARTDIFAGIAQRFSAFAAYGSDQADQPYCRGVNSFQFVKENGQWRIVSLLWQFE